MPNTNGFENALKRLEHFMDHGRDFGNCTIAEYEQMADVFLTEPLRSGVLECHRKSGARLRYDQTTGAFGILDKDAIIRTYFKPIPCWWLPVGYASAGNCHGHIDNMAYHQFECNK